MAITKIYVRKRGGTLGAAEIETSPVLSRSTGVDMQVSDTSATVSMPAKISGDQKYIEAYKRIMRTGYVSSINMTHAGQDGNLSILPGDGCLSWRPISSGISICDMCQPCSNCNDYARLKAYYEALRINLNSLKDVNIYDNELMASRRDALMAGRMNKESEGMESCDYADEYNKIKILNSIRLLKQYIALVHMWNWLAFTGRIKTDIKAQDYNDTHYMHIQSHFAIPSCDIRKVICTIEITVAPPSAGTTDSGTTDSGTTDDGTTDDGTTDSGTTDSGTTDSGTTDSGTTDRDPVAVMNDYASVYAEVRDVRYDMVNNQGDTVTADSKITHNSALDKTITATLSEINKAGTCVVFVSMCPFYYADQKSIVKPSTETTRTDELENGKVVRTKIVKERIQPFSGHIPITQLTEATEAHLKSSMPVEPSKENPGSTRWKVNITWEIPITSEDGTQSSITSEDGTQSSNKYISTLYFELPNPAIPEAITKDDVKKLAYRQSISVSYEYP